MRLSLISSCHRTFPSRHLSPFLIRRITLVSPLKSLSNPSTQSPCLFTSLHRRRIRGERTIYRLLFSRDRRRKKDADGSLLLSRMRGRDTEVARTFVHASVSSLVCVFPSHRLLVQIQFGSQTHQERERDGVHFTFLFHLYLFYCDMKSFFLSFVLPFQTI